MTELVNNSGQGKGTPVVDLVAKKFNWGAFLLSWIWGLGNGTYITLIVLPIAFIPFIGGLINLGLCIWFGIKGNEWAWQNKRFESIEAFHSYQKKWVIGWLIMIVVSMFLGIITALTIPTFMMNTNAQLEKTMRIKSISTATEISQLNEALENKCNLSSNGLAECYAKRLNVISMEGNKLTLRDNAVWTFNGDGYCINSGDCHIDIEYNNTPLVTIPLKLNANKYPMPDKNALE